MDDDNDDYLEEFLEREECPECGGSLQLVESEEKAYECAECGWTNVEEPDENEWD